METFISHVEAIAIKLGRIWQWMEEGIPYGIISACRSEMPGQNDENTQKLRKQLIARGYNPIWVRGGFIETPLENGEPIQEKDKDGNPIQEKDEDGNLLTDAENNPVYKIKRIPVREDSWLVRDIDLETLCRFGQQFKQESVVFYGGREGPFGTFYCDPQRFMQQDMSFLSTPPFKPLPDNVKEGYFTELQKGSKRKDTAPSGRKYRYITPKEQSSSGFRPAKRVEYVLYVPTQTHSFFSAMKQYHTEGRITSNLVPNLTVQWTEFEKL